MMRRTYLPALFITSLLLVSGPLHAQDPPASAPAVVADAPKAAETKVEEPKVEEPKVEDVLEDGKGAVSAIMAAVDGKKSPDSSPWLLWAAALAAFFKFLLTALRKYGKLLLSKQHMRLTVLVLGLLVFLFGKFAMGLGLVDAGIMAASGPGSLLVHEFLKLLNLSKWASKPPETTEA